MVLISENRLHCSKPLFPCYDWGELKFLISRRHLIVQWIKCTSMYIVQCTSMYKKKCMYEKLIDKFISCWENMKTKEIMMP